MSSPYIINEIKDGIAHLIIHRPERRNALNFEMYRALSDGLRAADLNPEVRVVVISGAQGYFTAGNDLADFIGYRKDPSQEFVALTFLKSIHALSKPLVAAVERGAVGVGATMLQYCDFAYAGCGTRFSLPFIHFGLCAEGGSTRLMAQGPAARQVARWLMLGDPFTADEALAAGLLTAVVEDDQALAQAMAVAQRLAAQSPEALVANKALIKAARGDVEGTLVAEIDRFTDLLQSDTTQEALRRFTTKAK